MGAGAFDDEPRSRLRGSNGLDRIKRELIAGAASAEDEDGRYKLQAVRVEGGLVRLTIDQSARPAGSLLGLARSLFSREPQIEQGTGSVQIFIGPID
jgi:hypothetical protein